MTAGDILVKRSKVKVTGDRQRSRVHNFWLIHTKFNVIGTLDVSMHVVDFGVNMSKVKDF